MVCDPSNHRYTGARGEDYLDGKAPLDIVVDVLSSVAQDPQSRDRIAQASVLSHGESAWVGECAWHAGHRGVHVARESKVENSPRTDLAINGTAIEFKSMFGVWAFDAKANSERERWLGPDIAKLSVCTAPAVMVITIAALSETARHQRPRYKVDWDLKLASVGELTPTQILEEGVVAAQRFLESRCVTTRRISFAPGLVPGEKGEVHLAAVVAAVNTQAASF